MEDVTDDGPPADAKRIMERLLRQPPQPHAATPKKDDARGASQRLRRQKERDGRQAPADGRSDGR